MESTPKTKKANRCAFEGCNARVVKIIGDCRYCQQKFCGKYLKDIKENSIILLYS